jgi:hypothetical protein
VKSSRSVTVAAKLRPVLAARQIRIVFTQFTYERRSQCKERRQFQIVPEECITNVVLWLQSLANHAGNRLETLCDVVNRAGKVSLALGSRGRPLPVKFRSCPAFTTATHLYSPTNAHPSPSRRLFTYLHSITSTPSDANPEILIESASESENHIPRSTIKLPTCPHEPRWMTARWSARPSLMRKSVL